MLVLFSLRAPLAAPFNDLAIQSMHSTTAEEQCRLISTFRSTKSAIHRVSLP